MAELPAASGWRVLFWTVSCKGRLGGVRAKGMPKSLDDSGYYEDFSRKSKISKTAMGVFERPSVATQVVHDLDVSAFPRDEIRTLGEPRDMAATGTMSTPRTDFEVASPGAQDNRGQPAGGECLRPRSAAWRSARFRDRIERGGGQRG